MRNAVAALAVLVSATAATVDAKAAMTDETLVGIFGDGKSSIPQMAQDCIRLLTGLDAAIYKDMPDDAVGVLKTQCRKDLQRRLDDPARNPEGLSLADVEQESVARLVTEYRARKKAAASKAHEAKKAAAAEENKAAWLKERDEVVAYYSGLDVAFSGIEALCREWAENLAAVPEAKRRPHWGRSPVCTEEGQAEGKRRAAAFVAKVQALDEDTGASGYTTHLLRPGSDLQQYSPEGFKSAEKLMREHIAQMKHRQSS